jgi:hypothetical protein
MRTHTIIAAALLATASLPAAAQTPIVGGVIATGPGQQVVVARPASFAETAVASCAGGAAIGALVVFATGGMTPVGTAALFCGLSVAATTASGVAVWTWHTITAPF